MRCISVFLLLMLFIPHGVFAQSQLSLLAPPGVPAERESYLYQLLSAALEVTSSQHEQVSLHRYVRPGGYSYRTTALMNHEVDVAYFLASKEYEQQVIPIRIPLYKGLMGYRTLLIEKSQQKKFSDINTISQLKALVKGSQSSWVTTKVIKYYGFNYISAQSMGDIYQLINDRKVDYSTRGVVEATQDLQVISLLYPNLKIEDKLLFYFELPMYFYVAKDRPQLAKRIHDGLMKIIASGKFDQLFDELFKTLPLELNLPDRRTIYLQNPYQSFKTRQNARTFWQYIIKKPAF